jgi:endonuclease/exonuclease/phosphatase family metal-dependent hydrolase
MMHLKRLCSGLALFPALSSCLAADADPAPVDATARSAEIETSGGGRRPGSITVMTRNQYLGADLTPIIAAPDAAAFNREALAALDQIAANHFPERAFSLALEIALQRPDVVGLQEVFDFRLNGAHGAPPYRDHLADTLQALSLLGQHYTVAAQVQNLAATIPIDTNSDGAIDAGVNVLDRDVILVRDGLAATPVPYSALCARPSLDGGPGCNYQVVVTAPSAVGPLAIERGFVGVDVTVNGRAYRVVDTHLEVPDIDPTNPLSAAVQAAQAQELIAILGASSPADRKLIVVGDINSSPKDVITQVGGVTIVPPYIQLAAAGFSDSFVVDPRVRDGFTCCQAEDLRNTPSQLNQRIDVIVSRERPASASDEVVGSRPGERTLINHLWPSDHAGVVARLQF